MLYHPYTEGRNLRAFRWALLYSASIVMMQPLVAAIWTINLAGFGDPPALPSWPSPAICLIPDCLHVAEYGTLGNYILQSLRLAWLAIDWPKVFSALYIIAIILLGLAGLMVLIFTWIDMRKTLYPARLGKRKEQ